MTRTVAVIVLMHLCIRPLAAQAPGGAVPLRLVRCAPGGDLACLEARVALDAPALAQLGAMDSAAEAHGWAGDLAGRMLVGPAVALPRTVVPPLRLLVLLDRSGSMIGNGIAFTRSALREFLMQLDSSGVRVAVAGFESHRVRDGITGAQFVTPREAADVLARLPKPDPQANTALYSALAFGSQVVAQATAATPGTQGAILLVTDGRNDVDHRGDDPGLLSGPLGLQTAHDAMMHAGQRVWIMGVGQEVARDTLAMLVGGQGSVTVASLDPNVMAARLDGISRELRAGRDLLFGMPAGSEATLARTAWSGDAVLRADNHAVITRELAWLPPRFAMPAFRGVADAAQLTPAMRAALTAGRSLDPRPLFALVLVLLGAACWILIPRVFWLDPAEAVEAGTAVPAPKAKAIVPEAVVSAAPDDGTLRRDVEEVTPRKSTDVTRQTARRAAATR